MKGSLGGTVNRNVPMEWRVRKRDTVGISSLAPSGFVLCDLSLGGSAYFLSILGSVRQFTGTCGENPDWTGVDSKENRGHPVQAHYLDVGVLDQAELFLDLVKLFLLPPNVGVFEVQKIVLETLDPE